MTTFLTNNALDLPEVGTTPTAPDAGRRKLYFGNDGYLYAVGSDNTAVRLQPTDEEGVLLQSIMTSLGYASSGEVLTPTGNPDLVEFAPIPTLPAKKMMLHLTQSGTDAPVLQSVIMNTFSAEPTINRGGVGYYRIQLAEFDDYVLVATCTNVSMTNSAVFTSVAQTAGMLRVYTENASGANADSLLDHIIIIEGFTF